MSIYTIQHLHLFFVALSLVSVFFSLLFSAFYLTQQWQLKNKKNIALFSKLPSLESLDRYVVRCLIVGSISMCVLVITGIYLAHIEWNRDWLQDEKFIVAILTWIWSIFTLVLRYKFGLRGEKFFYSILMSMLFLVASCLVAMVL